MQCGAMQIWRVHELLKLEAETDAFLSFLVLVEDDDEDEDVDVEEKEEDREEDAKLQLLDVLLFVVGKAEDISGCVNLFEPF